MYSIGSVPPENGDALTWLNSAITEPMPFSYTIEPIYKVLAIHFESEHHDVVIKMKDVLSNYCQYLLKRGEIADCNGPKKDREIKRTNSCKFCDSCGNGYDDEHGVLGHDVSVWRNFFNQFG